MVRSYFIWFGRKEDRNLLLLLLLISVAALSATWLVSNEVRVHLLKQQGIQSATKWAVFLVTSLDGLEEVLASGELTDENAKALEFATQTGGVFRFKMFNPEGVVTVATNPADLGYRSNEAYFLEKVKRGEIFVKIEEGSDAGSERTVVSEAYVPIMVAGVFRGALEVCVDMTPTDRHYRQIGSYVFWGVTTLLVIVALGWLSVLERSLRERDAREESLIETQAELGIRVSELQDVRQRFEAEAASQVALSEELSIARDEANAANRAKSQFLATMSHEIRTPMNGVLGLLGVLSETELTDPQHKYTKLAQDSAQSLLSIIDDILDYSKLEEGRIDLEEVDFSPAQVIDGVVSLMSSKAKDVGLSLSTEGTDDLPTWLRGDPTRLRQILFNLVGNAVKFTEQGGVRVIASHRLLEDLRIEFRIDVKDTGVGIPAEAQSKLFRRFSQADSSTTRRFGGSGLGLVICRQLAQLMGGGVGLQSEVGKGSTFWFTIRCDMGEAPVEHPHNALGKSNGKNLMKLRILVAEDNAVNQLVAQTMLTKAGHDVVVVENGREAVEAVQESKFDVVLMDVQMPEMDGPTATIKIRQLPKPVSEICIIALTANAMAGHREEYLSVGMDDYVTKPIDPRQLFAAMARVTKNRLADDSAAEASESGDVEQDAVLGLPLFDSEKFNDLRDALGDDGLQEALGYVPAEATKSIVQIRESISTGDLETAQRAAHSIKGMASNFGALRLQDIARQIEMETSDIESVTQKLPVLEDTMEQTQLEIDQLKSA